MNYENMPEFEVSDSKPALVLIVICIILITLRHISPQEELKKNDFDIKLDRGGDLTRIMTNDREKKVDYIKVEIDSKNGDKYDVRLKYSRTKLYTIRNLVTKKGLEANGKSVTIYFIPEKGECPGMENQCVRVPVVKNVTEEKHLINNDKIIYGIEIENDSLEGGTVSLKGAISYLN